MNPADLEQFVRSMATMSGGDNLPRWMYNQGRLFTVRIPLHKKLVRARSRCCYLNAWTYRALAVAPLDYCEGYVMLDSCPIPVMHGWLIDDAGCVHDPSVENEREAIYWGVTFDPEFAKATWKKLLADNAIGIIENAWWLRFRNLSDIKLKEQAC